MTVVDEELLSRVKGAANRATRGHWQTFPSKYGNGFGSVSSDDLDGCDVLDIQYYGGRLICESMQAPDRAYVVTCQPSVAIALVAEIRALRNRIRELENANGELRSENKRLGVPF
jgi:hypothetical protein